MKALSLWQPWASLVSLGAKTLETRSWSTGYRGPLLIHAAKRWAMEQRRLFQGDNPAALAFRAAICPAYGNPDAMPLGCFVALVDLVEVFPVEKVELFISYKEKRFGDYSAGRFAWKLENVRRIFEPIPARGYQALWTPDAGVVELVNQRVVSNAAS
jgi:hypothetical protein